MKVDYELLDDIFNDDSLSRRLGEMLLNDPLYKKAKEQTEALMAEVKQSISDDQYILLEDAMNYELGASNDVAIRFGMHLADTLREAYAHSAELSQYVLDRTCS